MQIMPHLGTFKGLLFWYYSSDLHLELLYVLVHVLIQRNPHNYYT